MWTRAAFCVRMFITKRMCKMKSDHLFSHACFLLSVLVSATSDITRQAPKKDATMFHSCGGGGGSAGGGDVSRGQGRRCKAHSVENGEGEAWVLRAGVLSRCEGPFVVEVEAEVEHQP